MGKYFLGRSEISNSADPGLYVWQVHPLGVSQFLVKSSINERKTLLKCV